MSQGIWIVEEHDSDGVKNIALELLSEGKKLAGRLREPLSAILIGAQVEANVAKLSQHGAEQVYLVEDDTLSTFNLDRYAAILVDLIKEYTPSVILIGATPTGAELAPRVAAKLRVPCITNVKKIIGSKDNLKITKSVYSDQAYVDIQVAPTWPLVLTIAPGETDVAKSRDKIEPVVIKADAPFSEELDRTKIGNFLKGDPRTIKLVEADRIVAGGKAAGEEGFSALQEFADLLEASIGGSRKAVDDGFISKERQIGISGNTVMPKLLIACGISGAREFTTGMENADLVIAVNTDEKARIFEFANLCIKGDLHKVIPALIKKLQPAKEKDTVVS